MSTAVRLVIDKNLIDEPELDAIREIYRNTRSKIDDDSVTMSTNGIIKKDMSCNVLVSINTNRKSKGLSSRKRKKMKPFRKCKD